MRAELRDGLEFLYADSEVSQKPQRSLGLDVARRGTAAVHLLVNDVPVGRRVDLRVLRNGRRFAGASWWRLVHVPVEVNTGPVGFIEREGERNRHVARRAPFRVFDAMQPMDGPFETDASTLALRLHLPAGPAGVNDYHVEIACGGGACRLRVRVRMYAVTMPPVGATSLPYTNWFHLRLMAEGHGLAPWSGAHWRMIRRYADLMARGRQNTFWIPLNEVFRMLRGEPVLNVAKLRRLVSIFTDAGLHFIEGGHVAGRTGGDWGATTFDVSVAKGVRATSPAGNHVLAAVGRQLMAEIKRNGWGDRWIQHVTDEPTDRNAVDYRILTGMVRRHMPGLPLLDATMDPELVGAVDIWCPQVQEYQKHRNAFEAQRKTGDRIWFYTCCFPGGPWLNRLLDQELLRPTLFGWAAALYDLDGFLHWGLNQYRPGQNPFEKSVVPHGGNNSLPAGDTHIVYPGHDGPWSSLRLEAQREGFEDYELLQTLKRRDPAKAQDIVGKVIRRFDRYTKDVTVLRDARREVLRALSAR